MTASFCTSCVQSRYLTKGESGRLHGHRIAYLSIYLLFAAGVIFSQNTTLVYEPDVQVGAAGQIRYLEERVDGRLTKRVDFAAPGVFADYMMRRNANGSLQRLVWYYDGDPADGNYSIEEYNSKPDGSWENTGLLTYTDGNLILARFFSGGTMVEERRYEYDADGVIKELITKTAEALQILLIFKRPDEGIVEAFERQLDGSELLIARLQYDDQERLILDERFIKGNLEKRDVYTYNDNGKLSGHVLYDDRDVAVRHDIYSFTEEGLPQSVIHLDKKNNVAVGINYEREQDGDDTKTIIKDSSGEITGTIHYLRENGRDVKRTETILLGDGELKIIYTDFDPESNWLSKATEIYKGGSLTSRTETSRVIRYFE